MGLIPIRFSPTLNNNDTGSPMSISRPRPQRGDFPPGTRQYGSSELGAPLLWFPAPQADSRSGLIIAGTHGDEIRRL
jgi:hypothetical protein